MLECASCCKTPLRGRWKYIKARTFTAILHAYSALMVSFNSYTLETKQGVSNENTIFKCKSLSYSFSLLWSFAIGLPGLYLLPFLVGFVLRKVLKEEISAYVYVEQVWQFYGAEIFVTSALIIGCSNFEKKSKIKKRERSSPGDNVCLPVT